MALEDLDASTRAEPPPPPPSGTTGEPADADRGQDFLLGILARPKRGGRWQLVAQHCESRVETERLLRSLRPRFPELAFAAVVVGFPAEHLGDLPGDGPIQLGEALADVIAVQAALIGLMGDEARLETRGELASRRRRILGLRVVHGSRT